jgi:hypothetical protein
VTGYYPAAHDVPGTAISNALSALVTAADVDRRQTQCTYWNGSIATFARNTATSYFVDSLGLQRVDAKVSFPVPTQKHMPILLHSCRWMSSQT